METVDRINRVLGQDAIRPAAMPARGKESGWGPRRDHESPEAPIHVVIPTHRYVPPKVRAFVDLLVDYAELPGAKQTKRQRV